MALPIDQIEEVRSVFGNAVPGTEGATSFVLVKNVRPLPGKADVRDVILLPEPRDGYPSRLYFSERIVGDVQRNWNGSAEFLGRTWYAFSWNGITASSHRLLTMLQLHLRGLVTP